MFSTVFVYSGAYNFKDRTFIHVITEFKGGLNSTASHISQLYVVKRYVSHWGIWEARLIPQPSTKPNLVKHVKWLEGFCWLYMFV